MVIQPKRLSWGPQAVDWQERININRLREERAARTRAEMKKRGIAVAILSGDNQRYATSIVGSPSYIPAAITSVFAIVFAEYPEDTIIYHTGEPIAQIRLHCPWIKPENLRVAQRFGPTMRADAVEHFAKVTAKSIIQDLKEKGLDKERVAADPMVRPLQTALENEGIKLESAFEMMTEARKIKTVDEVNCMKIAGAIVDMGWAALWQNLVPGITEAELAGIVTGAVMKGAPVGLFMVAIKSGPNTAPNYAGMHPTDRIIQVGDLLIPDIYGCNYNGYRTCCYRTFKCGTKPTQKEKDWHKQAREWLYLAQEAAKPGATTADIAQQFPPCSLWGAESEAERNILAVGHGLGLAQHEYPSISRRVSLDYPQPIEKGMVIALETWWGEDWVGGCRVENVGVITDSGFESLYTWPDEGITVAQHSLLIE